MIDLRLKVAAKPKTPPPVRNAMLTLATLPKAAKAMPAEPQAAFLAAYNKDFSWRCSEGHAEKAAWRVIAARWPDFVPKE